MVVVSNMRAIPCYNGAYGHDGLLSTTIRHVFLHMCSFNGSVTLPAPKGKGLLD